LQKLRLIFICLKLIAMEQPKTLKVVLGATCLALAIIFASGGAIAQTNKPVQATKIKTAPKKTTTAAPAVNIVLDKAPAINIMSKIKDTVGSFYYAIVNMPLEISGPPPAQDAAVTFVIASLHNPGAPTFAGQPGSGLSYTLTISKSLFKSNGGAVKDTVPVAVRFNKIPAESGSAYLSINGHPDDFIELNFNAAPSVSTTKHPAITLLDSTTNIQLDTFKKNVANHYPVKLYFRLSKGTGAYTSIGVKLIWLDTVYEAKKVKLSNTAKKLSDTTKHLLLSGDGKNTYKVTFAASDWNNKKDTTLSKNINLYVRQFSPVVNEQDITLHLDTGEGIHIVKLMPSKTLAKNTLTNPVSFENAQLISTKLSINHYFGAAVNTIDTVHIQVKLSGEYDAYANQLDFSIFDIDSVSSKHFQILKTPITLTQTDWDTTMAQPNSKHILTIPLYIRTIGLNDSTNNIHYINVVLKGQKNPVGGGQRIKIVSKEHPFWAEVGTNFDLLDKIKTNNLYAGVFGYLKDITGINHDQNNLSFTGGVYEAQSVTLGSSSASGFNYRDGSSTVPDTSFHTTPYQYYKDTGKIQSTTTIKSIGLLFSPQIRLTNTPTEEAGIHLYFSLYTEMLWQRVTSTLNYAQTAKTNTYQTGNLDSLLTNVPFKESEFDLDYRSQYT